MTHNKFNNNNDNKQHTPETLPLNTKEIFIQLNDFLDNKELPLDTTIPTLLLSSFSLLHHADQASLYSNLDSLPRKNFCLLWHKHLNAEFIVYLPEVLRAEFIHLIPKKTLLYILTQLNLEVVTDIVSTSTDEHYIQAVLDSLPTRNLVHISQLLKYPNDSVGRLMTPNYLSIPVYWSIGQTKSFLKKKHPDVIQQFSVIILVDASHQPVTTVSLSTLIVHDDNVPLLSLSNDENLISINVNLDQEDAVRIFLKYSLTETPVTDNHGKLVGLVSLKSIAPIILQEDNENMLHLAGVHEEDNIYQSLLHSFYSRFFWLFTNLITAIAASVIIALYASTIKEVIALAAILPIIASMSGNAGMQSITVVIQAIASGNISPFNTKRVVLKETLLGAFNGLIFALICSIFTLLWIPDTTLAFIVFVSVISALALAGFIGSVTPLILHKFHIDPSSSASVILTTTTDFFAFLSILALASLLLI